MTLVPLHAGPLTAFFDTDTAFLRYVRWEELELVRAVFAAVRDRNWDTVPYTLEQLQIHREQTAFQITFRAPCRHDSIQFEWYGRISGSPDGQIQFSFQGEAESSFLRNRIGLCVLHPITECAGQECSVEHSDGRQTAGTFPDWISPDQPFKQIRSISHRAGQHSRVHVCFDGDVFEMEDQRNWSDASFKTYSTPLELPFPVLIEVGTKIQQTVTIQFEPMQPDKPTAAASVDSSSAASPLVACTRAESRNIGLRLALQTKFRRPAIGFWLSDPLAHRHPSVVERLKQLGPEHLRVDVDLTLSDWESPLAAATDLARELGAALELALFAEQSDRQEWKRLAEILQPDSLIVARCLLFHPARKTTPEDLATAACQRLSGLDSTIPLAVGTDAYFAELNRSTPRATASKLVCFSINPQVHAFDNLSLRETLEALPAMVRSAHRLFDARVVVSPVSLRPRFNPNATSVSHSRAKQLDMAVDPRQSTGFGAAWTVGALAALATQPELDSLTIYEDSGPRGVLSSDGRDYPMTEIFGQILRSPTLFAVESSSPLNVRAVGYLSSEQRPCLCLANLSDTLQVVEILSGDTSQRPTVTLESESVCFHTLSAS